MLLKFISNSSIVHITANTYSKLSDPMVLTISQNLIFALNRWNSNYNRILFLFFFKKNKKFFVYFKKFKEKRLGL